MLACLFKKLQNVLVVILVILVVLVITVIPSFQLSGHFSFVTVTVIAALRWCGQSGHSRNIPYILLVLRIVCMQHIA